ncbi:MAG: RNA polymerase sigma factor [Janthinobacterium lividum]
MGEKAFNALYLATAKPLWRYVARVSGRQDVADDVLQETYLRLLRSERSSMQLADARPYLFRIATNLLHDRWRRGDDLQFKEGDEPSTEPQPENALDVANILQRLKPRARELLWLAYMEGMTHREIADVTNLNVLSVRVLLLRARREAAALLTAKGKSDVL